MPSSRPLVSSSDPGRRQVRRRRPRSRRRSRVERDVLRASAPCIASITAGEQPAVFSFRCSRSPSAASRRVRIRSSPSFLARLVADRAIEAACAVEPFGARERHRRGSDPPESRGVRRCTVPTRTKSAALSPPRAPGRPARSAARGSIRSRSRRRPARCSRRRRSCPPASGVRRPRRCRRPGARAPCAGRARSPRPAFASGRSRRWRRAPARAGPSAGTARDFARPPRAASLRDRRQQDRARVGIVLRLRDQVGGNPRRPARSPTRSTISLGPAWKSIAHSRDDERLRRRDIGVARPDDLVDPRDRRACRRRARRSRGRRRRGTGASTPATRAAQRTVASGFGQTAMTSRHAGDAGRDGRHQQRRRQRIAAARARSSRRGRAGARAARSVTPVTGCATQPRGTCLRGDARGCDRPRSRWRARTVGGDARARRGAISSRGTSIGPVRPSNCRA